MDRPRTEAEPRETGLPDSASFAARAAAPVKQLKATGQDAEVTLVALAGVEELQSALSDEARLDLESSVTTRSDEHTSELQSLMRISYAVCCLKKKTHTTNTQNNQHTILYLTRHTTDRHIIDTNCPNTII